MLFDHGGGFWLYSPYNVANNIQRRVGEAYSAHKTVSQGNDPYIRSRQKAYIKRLVSELSGYNNIIYEVANEDTEGSLEWQMEVVNDVRAADTANPHLVGISAVWWNTTGDELLRTNADWIAPGMLPAASPTVPDARKPTIFDTDHNDSAKSGRPCVDEVWQYFTRGYHISALSYNLGPGHTPSLNALGWAAYLANSRIADLGRMTPQEGGSYPASTGYALYNTGAEYLVYQPELGNVTVSLPAGDYSYEWYSADGDGPGSPTPIGAGAITSGGGSKPFTKPAGANVLYISADRKYKQHSDFVPAPQQRTPRRTPTPPVLAWHGHPAVRTGTRRRAAT
jgi:hypothetical protein